MSAPELHLAHPVARPPLRRIPSRGRSLTETASTNPSQTATNLGSSPFPSTPSVASAHGPSQTRPIWSRDLPCPIWSRDLPCPTWSRDLPLSSPRRVYWRARMQIAHQNTRQNTRQSNTGHSALSQHSAPSQHTALPNSTAQRTLHGMVRGMPIRPRAPEGPALLGALLVAAAGREWRPQQRRGQILDPVPTPSPTHHSSRLSPICASSRLKHAHACTRDERLDGGLRPISCT